MREKVKNKGLEKAILEYRKDSTSPDKRKQVIEELKKMKEKNALIGIVNQLAAGPACFFKRERIDEKLYLAMYSSNKYVIKEKWEEFLSMPFIDFLVQFLIDFTYSKEYGGIAINYGTKAEFVLKDYEFPELVDKSMIEKADHILEESEHIVL